MSNLYKVFFTAVLASLLLSACSTLSYTGDAKTEGYTHFKAKNDLKTIHSVIMKTGEKEGWRMTEFKYNSILAEKVLENETKSFTIDFTKDSLVVVPTNDALEETLVEALDK